MRESTMYQSILREGRTEGRAEGERELVLKLLNRKVGSLSPQLQARVSGLSIDRLEALGEALLDFQGVADLESWLETSR
jgi:predicted transposase YdaD